MITVRIDRTEVFADGKSLGTAGSYERVIGVVRGEIDPADPRNAGIVNIDKAQRNAAGKLEYEADLFLLRPVDPKRRNGKVLYEFPNRGRKLFFPWVNDAPEASEEAGTGFFLRDGWTLAWSGWDGTIAREHLMGIGLPIASDGGAPLRRPVREEVAIAAALDPTAPSPRFKLTYAAVDPDAKRARLTVRYTARGEAAIVSPELWAFEDARTIVLRPEAGPFDPAALYDVHYVAENPTVLGLGFPAARDLLAWLRYEQPEPARSLLGLGISLSGRFAHEFLELGMNSDLQGRRIFDGLLIYIAGAGKTFTNFEFGQPGRTRSQHADHDFPENWFPFAYAADEVRIFAANSSSEYWQKGASLIHTDPQGTADLALPPNVRAYLVAGTQHAAIPSQQNGTGPCACPRNMQGVGPVLRAMLAALDAWASDGTMPPPSAVPLLADGTLVAAGALTFPQIGPPPPAEANPVEPYRVLVPAVDDDGNERAGIRLPDVAVPRGTYTGWNFFRSAPAATELCNHAGTFIPFARTATERRTNADPRPSVEERYGTRDDYARRVQDSCDALVRDRFLLEEDVPRYIARAQEHHP
jgi:hypothetical protein